MNRDDKHHGENNIDRITTSGKIKLLGKWKRCARLDPRVHAGVSS